MFLVQVAADIFGNKQNFELSFPGRPSVQELQRAAETAFSNEIQLRRPAGVPPHQFRLNKIKVYNEETNKWADLRAEAQLIDSCQCYAFQLENAWHKETQKEIPPAVRPPPSALAPASAPAAAPGSASTYGAPNTNQCLCCATQPSLLPGGQFQPGGTIGLQHIGSNALGQPIFLTPAGQQVVLAAPSAPLTQPVASSRT